MIEDQSPLRHTIGSCESVLFLVNLGIGIFLSVGAIALYYAGLILGMVAQIMGSLAFFQGSYSYLRLSIHTRAYTIEDLAQSLLGSKCELITNFINFLGLFLFSVSILYIAGTSLMGAFIQLLGYQSVWTSQTLCILYVGLGMIPFILRKHIKGIKSAAIIMLVVIVLFIILQVIYLSLYGKQIRSSENAGPFPLWPPLISIKALSKCMAIFFSNSFALGILPVFYSYRNLTLSSGLKSTLITYLLIIFLFSVISILALDTFRSLLTKQDTIMKAFYHYSRSAPATLTQLLFTFIGLFHLPQFLFNGREALLQFFNRSCKFARRPHSQSHQREIPASSDEGGALLAQPPIPFHIMYDRVPPKVFYLVALILFACILLSALLITNLLSFLDLVLIPIVIYISNIFPNICILVWHGWREEKIALASLVLSTVAMVIGFVASVWDMSS